MKSAKRIVEQKKLVLNNDSEMYNNYYPKMNFNMQTVWKKIIKKHSRQKLDNLTPPEDDEVKVKERKELKILTPNKLLTRLPVFLAQTKAEVIHTN